MASPAAFPCSPRSRWVSLVYVRLPLETPAITDRHQLRLQTHHHDGPKTGMLRMFSEIWVAEGVPGW